MNIYIMSLNKKLDEQTRGFKFCFLFKPFNKHLGMELWPNSLAPCSWAFIIDDAATAVLRYSHFTLIQV